MSREVARWEMGLVGGVAADLGRRMVLDVRYTHGLTGLNTDRSDGFRVRNRAVSVTGGVRFPLGRRAPAVR